MKRVFTVSLCLFAVMAFSFTGFAQDYSKDLSQAPTEFNNPTIITTPGDAVTSALSESFEDPTFPPAGWSLLSPDGGTGWERQIAGTTPFPGWTGGTVIAPPGGGNAVAYATWTTGGAVGNDQWLLTPQITNVQTGDSLSFWMWFPFSSFADSVDVLISTTGTAPVDFDIIVEQFYLPVGSADTSWTQYTYTLTDFVSAGSDIYIAWREHVADNLNDGAVVCLDLVEVISAGGGACGLFTDTFDSDIVLWTEVGPNFGNWSWQATNNAAGAGAGELEFYWLPSFTDSSSYIMSPVLPSAGWVNTTISFAHFVDYYSSPMTVGCATTTDGGATWTTVWSVTDPGANVGPEVVTVPFTGDANLQIGFFFSGSTFAIDYWYIDDVCVDGVVPVELTSFTASVNEKNVTLNWTTATETNNQGFEIERNSGNGFQNIGYVAGFGTSAEPHSYSFIDASLNEGTYSYRLKQLDFDGTFAYFDAIEVDIAIPDVFALAQNYPNPFNPSTKIDFSLAVDSKVSLKVFDVLGQEVATLINTNLAAGSHNVDFNAASINSGVYFYRIEATGIDGTNFTNVKKMILTK